MSARDAWRYILAVVIAFITGVIMAGHDGHMMLSEVLWHGALTTLPTLTALRMTLEGDKSSVSKPKGDF